MKYKYVILFVCIKSDFIVPYPLENLTAQSIHDAFSYIIDFMRVRFRKKVKKILADCFTSFAEKRLVEDLRVRFRRNLLLTKPITYHMDSITELHPLVEGYLMDACVQGE